MLTILAALLFMTINGSSESSNKNESSSLLPELKQATFAGGCFWCMEPPFEKLPGVSKVISGYTGGKKENPNYKEVATGSTDHAEAIEIHYDSSIISYNDLLEVLWRNIDPTDGSGQFVDRGKHPIPQNRTRTHRVRERSNLWEQGPRGHTPRRVTTSLAIPALPPALVPTRMTNWGQHPTPWIPSLLPSETTADQPPPTTR